MLAMFIDYIIHFDKYLNVILQMFGVWTYVILFLIIFCETGLVVTPFLPGDSLLFTIGAFAALGSFDVAWVLFILTIAAILGDSVNYAVGKYLGQKICEKANGRFIKKEYLDRTHKFYEKYGAKTIVIARFVPIVRTFAPFVAGVGTMRYITFLTYNIIGGVLWVGGFVLAGYFFGNIPVIKNNFSLVILVIIVLSVLPAVIEFLRHYKVDNRCPDA